MAKCATSSHSDPPEHLREMFLATSARAGLIGSVVVTLALAFATVALGALPPPTYAVPALLCGWARCGPLATAANLVIAAGAAAAAASGDSVSIGSWAGSLLVLSILWIASLSARKAFDNEHRNARRDSLTGCLTLKAFHEALGMKLVTARKLNRPVALAYLDLDHFKDVNDRFGHAVGDRLLHEFATELRSSLLPEDIVGRLGGDEFAVLLAEVHGPCAVQRFERLVHEILGNQHFPVTASIGALIIEAGAIVSQSELIVMTDELMYEAKRSGKATLRTTVVQRPNTKGAELAA